MKREILGDSSSSFVPVPISQFLIDVAASMNRARLTSCLSLVTFLILFFFSFFFSFPFYLFFFFFFATLLHRLNRVSAIDCEASQLREKSMKEVRKRKEKGEGRGEGGCNRNRGMTLINVNPFVW